MSDYLQWLVSPDNGKFNIFPTGLDHLWGEEKRIIPKHNITHVKL